MGINKQYGKININTGKYKAIGTLRGSSMKSYVFAQDSNGVLHYINGDGKYYTNSQSDDRLRAVPGVSFPLSLSKSTTDLFPRIATAICGEFDATDHVIIAPLTNLNSSAKRKDGGGLIRFSLSTMSIYIQKTTKYSKQIQDYDNVYFKDLTTIPLSHTKKSKECSS